VTEFAEHLWDRAQDALRAAKHVLPVSADAAASSAYYAAFYAVSAHFALKGKTFRKHTAVETAVHRDLVRAGIWPADLGEGFSDLVEMRENDLPCLASQPRRQIVLERLDDVETVLIKPDLDFSVALPCMHVHRLATFVCVEEKAPAKHEQDRRH
jgi:uncharacterized protein (UPF0332 family)